MAWIEPGKPLRLRCHDCGGQWIIDRPIGATPQDAVFCPSCKGTLGGTGIPVNPSYSQNPNASPSYHPYPAEG